MRTGGKVRTYHVVLMDKKGEYGVTDKRIKHNMREIVEIIHENENTYAKYAFCDREHCKISVTELEKIEHGAKSVQAKAYLERLGITLDELKKVDLTIDEKPHSRRVSRRALETRGIVYTDTGNKILVYIHTCKSGKKRLRAHLFNKVEDGIVSKSVGDLAVPVRYYTDTYKTDYGVFNLNDIINIDMQEE